jgi:type IV pilus assembly protein PilW
MVALAIGLIILAASSALLVNSKKNYVTQDSLARLQENARFAMQFLIHDIRMAGYYGCADDIKSVNSTLNSPTAFAFNFNDPIEGSESGGNMLPSNTSFTITPTPVTDSDAIAIRGLDTGNPINVVYPMNQDSSSLKVTQGSGIGPGDVIMVTDCSSADLLQVTDNTGSTTNFDNLVHNSGTTGIVPGNSTQKLSKSYTNGTIFRFITYVYYIAVNNNGVRALYRQGIVNSSGTASLVSQELVEGIDSLQLLYGIDTNGDRIPDSFVKANDPALTNWANVVAVRIGILASTLTNDSTPGNNGKQSGTDIDTKVYSVNNTNIGPMNDRRQRRVFMSTVIPRNLQ